MSLAEAIKAAEKALDEAPDAMTWEDSASVLCVALADLLAAARAAESALVKERRRREEAEERLSSIWLALRDSHHITIRINGGDKDGGWIKDICRPPREGMTPGEMLLRTPTAGLDMTKLLFPPPRAAERGEKEKGNG